MNNFKNQANSLYVIHKDKFSKVLASREEIKRENSYDKLCTLVDADYVKYALEVFKKK